MSEKPALHRLVDEYPIKIETHLTRSEIFSMMEPFMDPSIEQWNFHGITFIVTQDFFKNAVMRFKLDDTSTASYFKLKFAKV